MPRKVTKDDCLAEVDRFFKNYHVFCKSPEPDSVREVLASIYSVNDKVRKAGYPDFFNSDEFLAVKAVRNYAIHQAEIYNEARSLPLMSAVPIEATLSFLCLIPRSVIENICANTDSKSAAAIRGTCVFYRNYVDIYPSIFNFGVQLFLYTETHRLEVDSREYLEFSNMIEFEREKNLPHQVVGGFKLTQGGDIDDFIDNSLHSIVERTDLRDTYYSEENGMFTFKGID